MIPRFDYCASNFLKSLWYNSLNVKKILLVLCVIFGSFLLWNYAKTEEIVTTIKTISDTVTTSKISLQTKEKQYVFVPYWTFTRSLVTDSKYSLIYFGIGVNAQGVDTTKDGYSKLKLFIKLTPNTNERILAVRMTDKIVNAQILKSLSVQRKIASQAVELAIENNFDGVLLDYETSAFGFDTTTNNITSFYKIFSDNARGKNLLFYTTVYGDTYFRARPYDIKKISDLSDKVLIMAYDFSKSRGNPGPNFPLKNDGQYGYDFQTMVNDFQGDADNRKLVVVFGYFGYDWKVSSDGAAVASGIPLSTNEIKQDFVDECEYQSCSLNRSSESQEPSIRYVDEDGENHVIWFEDAQSAQKKKEFLKSKGILEIADWAYSYN